VHQDLQRSPPQLPAAVIPSALAPTTDTSIVSRTAAQRQKLYALGISPHQSSQRYINDLHLSASQSGHVLNSQTLQTHPFQGGFWTGGSKINQIGGDKPEVEVSEIPQPMDALSTSYFPRKLSSQTTVKSSHCDGRHKSDKLTCKRRHQDKIHNFSHTIKVAQKSSINTKKTRRNPHMHHLNPEKAHVKT
jgi:hypothetical protein